MDKDQEIKVLRDALRTAGALVGVYMGEQVASEFLALVPQEIPHAFARKFNEGETQGFNHGLDIATGLMEDFLKGTSNAPIAKVLRENLRAMKRGRRETSAQSATPSIIWNRPE